MISAVRKNSRGPALGGSQRQNAGKKLATSTSDPSLGLNPSGRLAYSETIAAKRRTRATPRRATGATERDPVTA
jgi:hypothetical protein